MNTAAPDPDELLDRLDADLSERLPADGDRPRVAHRVRLPARRARTVPLPDDLPRLLRDRLERAGIATLYTHQAQALDAVRRGRHTVIATGPASGKSLCYQLPILEQLCTDETATALYLAPTKALAQDQLRALRDFRLPHARPATYDGDTPARERDAIRRTANVVLTNPDMLHVGILPGHRRWGDFLHRLAVVVVDECHVARGVFGSHVAAVLRRLRRLAARYGADPVFVLASATIGNPAEHAGALTGLDVVEIAEDGAPKPALAFALWEPPLLDAAAGARRSTLAETADLLAALVTAGPQTLAFVKSRKGAEVVAKHAGDLLADAGKLVLAYRAGLLAEERRGVERGLADGTIAGVAATDALELGVDIGTLDAVLIAGWPGTLASLWQQAGRAGRRDRDALVVFVADDDPLDRYLLAHPDHVLARPLEAAVTDLTNPYVLRPHLHCAAWEVPIDADDEAFAPAEVGPLLAEEVAAGRLRERGGRHFWTGRGSPAGDVDIRGIGGEPYRIVEQATGVLIGAVDADRAFRTVHAGAVYLHQGRQWRVRSLDLDARVAAVEPYTGEEYTRPRTDTDIHVLELRRRERWGRCALHHGHAEVTNRVLAYERRRVFTDESLGVVELDLPPTQLVTQALWLTIEEGVLVEAGVGSAGVAGAAHAAEHAAIALLPLFAMCDRWDIGGVSTPWHPDTGEATIFVYDGHPGGAGITERGFAAGPAHLQATFEAVAACPCGHGCPSCVQSPKCGNGNEPLDKDGAARLLEAVLREAGARR